MRELCTDARIPTDHIARKIGHSRDMVRRRITFLEREFGLRYVLELDEVALGLNFPTLIRAKLRRIPDKKWLSDLLSNTTPVQFAALGKGDYDLLICFTATDRIDYLRWTNMLRGQLKDYVSEWKAALPILYRVGFFALREPVLKTLNLPEPQKSLLLALQSNARASFSELSERLKISESTVRYQVNKLLKSGFVKRATALVQNPPSEVQMAIFGDYTFPENFEERNQRARKLVFRDDESMPVNRINVMAELSGAADSFLFGSFPNIHAAHEYLRMREEVFGGPEAVPMQNCVFSEKLAGLWPLRNMDLAKAYDRTSWAAPTS